MADEQDREYRIVCKSFGQPKHHTHAWTKETLTLAKRYRDKKDEEVATMKMAPLEIPHRIQSRVPSQWEDLES